SAIVRENRLRSLETRASDAASGRLDDWLLGVRSGLGSCGLREEAERVDQLTVREDLVVEVRAGCAAGGADVAEHRTAADALAGLHGERAQVAVSRRQPETVLDDDEVAVFAGVGGRFDAAVGGGVHRLAFIGRDVEPLVERRLAAERIAAAAEGAGEPAVRRPDGRRRVGERFLTL